MPANSRSATSCESRADSGEGPLWALRIFILVALLGFPIALVMAWVFDVTPEGVRLDPSVSGNKRVFAGVDPVWDPLRKDPRFEKLVAKAEAAQAKIDP